MAMGRRNRGRTWDPEALKGSSDLSRHGVINNAAARNNEAQRPWKTVRQGAER
jgi:hypothetical protein